MVKTPELETWSHGPRVLLAGFIIVGKLLKLSVKYFLHMLNNSRDNSNICLKRSYKNLHVLCKLKYVKCMEQYLTHYENYALVITHVP